MEDFTLSCKTCIHYVPHFIKVADVMTEIDSKQCSKHFKTVDKNVCYDYKEKSLGITEKFYGESRLKDTLKALLF